MGNYCQGRPDEPLLRQIAQRYHGIVPGITVNGAILDEATAAALLQTMWLEIDIKTATIEWLDSLPPKEEAGPRDD